MTKMEGVILKEWLTAKKWSTSDLAEEIGVSKQNISYHMKKSTLSDAFKQKLKDKGYDIFSDDYALPHPTKTSSQTISEQLKNVKPDEAMEREMAALRQRLADMAAMLSAKDEVIKSKDEVIEATVKLVEMYKKIAPDEVEIKRELKSAGRSK